MVIMTNANRYAACFSSKCENFRFPSARSSRYRFYLQTRYSSLGRPDSIASAVLIQNTIAYHRVKNKANHRDTSRRKMRSLDDSIFHPENRKNKWSKSAAKLCKRHGEQNKTTAHQAERTRKIRRDRSRLRPAQTFPTSVGFYRPATATAMETQKVSKIVK